MVLRPTVEKKEEKERVRTGLLRAALRLAAAHGFASLGLREVAREGGIAPTSFYRHFADMEELGIALIGELAGQVMRELGERALSAAPAEVVPAVSDTMFTLAAKDPELMRFIAAEQVGAFARFRALLRGDRTAFARTLHAAVRGEPLAPAAPAPAGAEAAVSLLFDAAIRALDEPPDRLESVRDALMWAMWQLLELGATSPRPK
jgi:AcrR family transcriptional regulator